MRNRVRNVLAAASGWAVALAMGATLAGFLETLPVIAKPQTGKYSGNSTYWVPDYVGTIEFRSSGDRSYTAIADVELKQKPPNPHFSLYGMASASIEYEIRGSVTLATPYVVSRAGRLLHTCTAGNSAPLWIARSNLRLYVNDQPRPKNSYELGIESANIRLPNCVDAKGQSLQDVMSVRLNTSDRPYAASDSALPTLSLTPAEQAEIDRVTQAGKESMENPRLEQELATMIAQDEATFRRTGKRPSAEEIATRMERLQRQGILPTGDNIPSLSPALQRKLDAFEKAAAATSDYSYLRRVTNIDRLKDTMTFDWGSILLNVSWDLRRVNAR